MFERVGSPAPHAAEAGGIGRLSALRATVAREIGRLSATQMSNVRLPNRENLGNAPFRGASGLHYLCGESKVNKR